MELTRRTHRVPEGRGRRVAPPGSPPRSSRRPAAPRVPAPPPAPEPAPPLPAERTMEPRRAGRVPALLLCLGKRSPARPRRPGPAPARRPRSLRPGACPQADGYSVPNDASGSASPCGPLAGDGVRWDGKRGSGVPSIFQ